MITVTDDGPEPWLLGLRPLPLAGQGAEEVPVGDVQVREGLLEHNGGHAAQPLPFGGPLRLGDEPP